MRNIRLKNTRLYIRHRVGHIILYFVVILISYTHMIYVTGYYTVLRRRDVRLESTRVNGISDFFLLVNGDGKLGGNRPPSVIPPRTVGCATKTGEGEKAYR